MCIRLHRRWRFTLPPFLTKKEPDAFPHVRPENVSFGHVLREVANPATPFDSWSTPTPTMLAHRLSVLAYNPPSVTASAGAREVAL